MGCLKVLIFLVLLNYCHSKGINLNILPDGKATQLAPPASPDFTKETREIQWNLTTLPDHRIRLYCRMKVKDCLAASLTINNGKEESTYCGRRGAQVMVSSDRNYMTVELETRGPTAVAVCLASSVKSFVNFDSPEGDSSEAGVKAGKKATTCSCGWANKSKKRIVGGVETKINEFPFAALIVRMDLKIAFCGGSIITPYHILTAAHCTYKLKGVPLVASVGEHNLSTTTETKAMKIMPVKEFIDHNEFNSEEKFNDISILVLKNKIEFNQFVGPICLTKNRQEFQNGFVKVMGWGRLYDHGPQSKVLMKANLKIIDFKQCLDFYTLRTKDANQFCTFGHDKDTCSGDSGGPVVWLDPETNRYTQVGLVSYGKGCAMKDVPGVNTDVAYFYDWIQKVIKDTAPESTCSKI